MLTRLNIVLSQDNKNKAAEFLRELKWEPAGTRSFLGKQCVAWTRRSDSKDLELNIRKLELLNDRQNRDLEMIDAMLERGFSKDECLMYLRMIYDASLEVVSETEEEEEEARQFAKYLVQSMGISKKMSQIGSIFEALAYTYYIDKNYPELSGCPLYLQQDNFINASLETSGLKLYALEWQVLSYEPCFLDFMSKITDNVYVDFKKFVLTKFISKDTCMKFNLYDLDTRILPALCITCRRLKNELPKQNFIGLSPRTQKKIYDHAKKLQQDRIKDN